MEKWMWMVEYDWSSKPQKVKVVSETEKTWTEGYESYNGRRATRRRNKDKSMIFDDFEEAKSLIIENKMKEIEHLERINGELGNLKGMKP